MITAGLNAVVFRPAGRAHLKPPHRGQRPVIGQALHDGKSGAAVGAVDKGVAVAPVSPVPQLPETVGTGGNVGADESIGAARPAARQDVKALLSHGGSTCCLPESADTGQRGQVFSQGGTKPGQCRGSPLHLQFHAEHGISAPAGKLMLSRQPVEEGTKAHSLHDALYLQMEAAKVRHLPWLPRLWRRPPPWLSWRPPPWPSSRRSARESAWAWVGALF